MQHSPQNQWDVCLAWPLASLLSVVTWCSTRPRINETCAWLDLLLSFCQLSPGAGALRVSVICPLKTRKLPKLTFLGMTCADLYCLGWKGGSLKKKRRKKKSSVWVDPNLPGQVGVPLEHSTAHHQNPTHWSRGCPTGVEHTAHHLNPTNWSSECPTGTHSIPSKPHKLVKWVSHWNKLHTTKTPQTGQEGVAQEHTAHQPNPTNWPSNFQSAASTWPVYFCVALASIRCAHSFYSSIGQCQNTPMFAQVWTVVTPQIMYAQAWNMIEWIKQSFYLPSVSLLCVRMWLIYSCSLKRSVRIAFQTTRGHFSEREQTGEAFRVPQKMRHWSSESRPIRINLISMES